MNELKVYTKSATLTTSEGKYKMPAETGNTLKKIFEFVTVSENSSLALAVMCAKVRADKMYKDILDESGDPVCDTFGDFAEKILGMSKAFGSLHASVGEVFADELAEMKTEWKYTQLEELLKLRKKLDTEGNPAFATGAEIIDYCYECGITPKSTVREIRGFVDAVLNKSAESDTEDAGEDAGEENTEESENTEETPAEKISELLTALAVYTNDKKSKGLLADLAAYLSSIYTA